MKLTTIGIICLLVAVMSLSVLAVKTEDVQQQVIAGKAIANQTYGNCVSDSAGLKNTCYKTVKDQQATCKETAKNQTDSKVATKECKKTYSKDMSGCKATFKFAKKECSKIKHNFMESLKSSMK